jgi:hypothetical protein
VGLLHYPVYNKNYETIASAITTFDLHDCSRLAKTYGVKTFFVITPLAGAGPAGSETLDRRVRCRVQLDQERSSGVDGGFSFPRGVC